LSRNHPATQQNRQRERQPIRLAMRLGEMTSPEANASKRRYRRQTITAKSDRQHGDAEEAFNGRFEEFTPLVAC